MAACGSEEKLPTLRITFEELQQRSILLPHHQRVDKMEEAKSNNSSSGNTDEPRAHTGGLLYLSPTKDFKTTEEKKRKRNRRRNLNRDPINSPLEPRTRVETTQPCDHGHKVQGVLTSNQLPERRGKSNGHQRLKKPVSSEGPHSRAFSDGLIPRKDREVSREKLNTETSDLESEWSGHERSRKVEKALSKLSGDVTKLDPVVQTWLVLIHTPSGLQNVCPI